MSNCNHGSASSQARCTRVDFRRFSTKACRRKEKKYSGGVSARFYHLDRHLGEHEYLMGKDFSVADVHLFVISNWASKVAFDLASYPIVVSYRKRIAQRRAVRAAMTTGGLAVH
ncbi:MAG: glutathione S-transferase family protein [Pseudolabrys sp.]